MDIAIILFYKNLKSLWDNHPWQRARHDAHPPLRCYHFGYMDSLAGQNFGPYTWCKAIRSKDLDSCDGFCQANCDLMSKIIPLVPGADRLFIKSSRLSCVKMVPSSAEKKHFSNCNKTICLAIKKPSLYSFNYPYHGIHVSNTWDQWHR